MLAPLRPRAPCNVVIGGMKREGATAAARATMRWKLTYLLVSKQCHWEFKARGKN